MPEQGSTIRRGPPSSGVAWVFNPWRTPAANRCTNAFGSVPSVENRSHGGKLTDRLKTGSTLNAGPTPKTWAPIPWAARVRDAEAHQSPTLRQRQRMGHHGAVWTASAALLICAIIGNAYLMTVAQQSTMGWWFGCVALLPLLMAIRAATPVQAMLAGGLWGASLGVFSLTGGGVPLAPTFTSFALLTVVPALYGLFGVHVTRRVGFSPLLLGIGWVAVEFALRPLAFRHGLLAATQGDGLFIRTLGHLGGYVLVAFLVAYVSASLLSMLSDVCVSIPRSPYVTGRGSGKGRLFPWEAPVYLGHFVHSARPRAPPE